jgi:hypothetical protein
MAAESSSVVEEPTGRTIDGTPWEEPRPPHLPDALTRVSPLLIPFVLLAGLQADAAWLDWVRQGDLRGPNALELIVMQWLPGVCVSLLGAALFYRHPDAHRRLPMLTMGVVLLALAALVVAIDPIDQALMNAAPVDAENIDSAFLWHGIYAAAITVVNIFGLVYVARGLAGARRFGDVMSGRAVGIALIALVAVASVVSLVPYFTTPEAAELLTPVNVVSLVLAKIETLAWIYLLVIAFGGWLAGERPRIGWLLVALAAVIEVFFLLVLVVSGLVDLSQGGFFLRMLTWLGIAKFGFLLAAFALGLPSTAPVSPSDEPAPAPTADPQAATRSDSAAG